MVGQAVAVPSEPAQGEHVSAGEPENGVIRFTTKELLGRIDNKLDGLDAKLDTKADRSRVHELGSSVAALQLGKADKIEVAALDVRLQSVERSNSKFTGGLVVVGVLATSSIVVVIANYLMGAH